MIGYEDQMSLFELVGKNIREDIECFAFGGTAMMFYGYKDQTKDIDVVFGDEKPKRIFIQAIQGLGFEETTPMGIYIPEKLREKNKPVMYKRSEFRFDIFTRTIFRTKISPRMKEDLFAVHDFKGKRNLRIKVLIKEHIVLLKAITERDKDFEDILTILQKEKHFGWQYLIDETIWQHRHGDEWAILDVEEMMQKLKKYVLIESKYFKQLYKAQEGG